VVSGLRESEISNPREIPSSGLGERRIDRVANHVMAKAYGQAAHGTIFKTFEALRRNHLSNLPGCIRAEHWKSRAFIEHNKHSAAFIGGGLPGYDETLSHTRVGGK
jgi:hypothetical protein